MFSNPVSRAVVLLALVASQFHAVEAGSRHLQPRITKYDHLDIGETPIDEEGVLRRMSQNHTSLTGQDVHDHSKRYLIYNEFKAQPWPKNTVRYCFEDEAAKEKLFDDVKDAINRWWASGLDQSVFKFEEVSDDVCKSERASVLVVHRTQNKGGHSATLGFPKATDNSPGPVLNLDDNAQWSSDDRKIGAIAHEIGHVWGLHHEHQNPRFWKEEGITYAQGGTVFGSGTFNCQNIRGYAEAAEAARKDRGDAGVQRICTSAIYASVFDFLASQFLPKKSVDTVSQPGHDAKDVDWKSIMIYPTYAGAKDASSPILKQPDGSDIPENNWPSALDVAGINKLYTPSTQVEEELLNKKSNPKRNMFDKIFRKSRGDAPCDG